MANRPRNPNPLHLIGIASITTLFFVVGVLGIVRDDWILAIVFLGITIALVVFMLVVYLSARRRLLSQYVRVAKVRGRRRPR